MARKYYIVKEGDTLSEIAAKHNTSAERLAAINDISNINLISVGEKIWLEPEQAGTPKKPKPKTTKTVRMKQFGQSSAGDKYSYFAVWEWTQSHTDYFDIRWEYLRDGIWWEGSRIKQTYDPYATKRCKQSTYDAPTDAVAIRFKVRPFSKKKKTEGSNKETYYWTADWCDWRVRYIDMSRPPTPQPPSISAVKNDNQIQIQASDIDPLITYRVQFKIWIEDEDDPNSGHVYSTSDVYYPDTSGPVICIHNVHRGRKYRAAVRVGNTERWSEWSAYSSESVTAIPTTPDGIKILRAESGFGDSNAQGTVYIYWYSSRGADSYIVGYSENRRAFSDGGEITTYDTSSSADPKTQYHRFNNIEKGKKYYFSVKAKNATGESSWCPIKSLISGTAPAAPSIWSSADVVVVGEQSQIFLHWQHNSKDSSYERFATIEFTSGDITTEVVKAHPNTTDEDKHKPGEYIIDTVKGIVGDDGVAIPLVDGATVKWRVKTAGVLEDQNGPVYGPYSATRELRVYTKPKVSILMQSAEAGQPVTSYPIRFDIQGSGFYNQTPVGCGVTITAQGSYDTRDGTGRPVRVNAGDVVYRTYISGAPDDDRYAVTVLPGDSLLENDQSYSIRAVLSASSGLDAEATTIFTAQFGSIAEGLSIDAEITFDPNGYTATISPVCRWLTTELRQAKPMASGLYYPTENVLGGAYYVREGPVGQLRTGEPVYESIPDEYPPGFPTHPDEKFFSVELTSSKLAPDVMLSVYRRDFDGGLTEIAVDIPNTGSAHVTDPHPALDYARYRIVATSITDGWVTYYDMPGVPTNVPGAVIQWAENWTNYDQTDDNSTTQETWSGSFLHLPYNLDTTEESKPDLVDVNYIGRAHPVAYYGTQVGQSASWQVAVPAYDTETLYALRRLARWTGNVYVREQSGSGYWAAVQVSYGQKHLDLVISVTLHITRVEGGEA